MKTVEKNRVKNIIMNMQQHIETINERCADDEKKEDELCMLQEMAIDIGSVTEMTEGVGCDFTLIMEKVCELLYQFSEELDNVIYIKLIAEELTKALHEINSNIKEKKEVVFISYQVSMWDSLASVYDAARMDKNVNARLIPIPYYEVNRDNSLGTFHEEQVHQYPDSLEITDYNLYDIEKVKPDIIFFNNPYDAYNSVTRVPPKYYAENMKKHTNMLVYIPYMLSCSGGPSEKMATSPGVLFSDKVIVQEGEVGERYIRLYMDAYKNLGTQYEFSDSYKKFLRLGSPKYDALVNVKVDYDNLPEEWKKKIYNKELALKKIIFYNVTISYVLNNPIKAAEKIIEFYKVMSINKNEFSVIWRPHPLLMQTIEAMIPFMKEIFVRIYGMFDCTDWCIVDDGPDGNVALAISDAYCGGGYSSLEVTYQILNRPILHQEYELTPLVDMSSNEKCFEHSLFQSEPNVSIMDMLKFVKKADVCVLNDQINYGRLIYNTIYKQI